MIDLMTDSLPEETCEDKLNQQDIIIGQLMRKNAILETTQTTIQQSLHNMKKEAGFTDSTSFDNVWKEVLKAYLK